MGNGTTRDFWDWFSTNEARLRPETIDEVGVKELDDWIARLDVPA
jgi:hypothetical protein